MFAAASLVWQRPMLGEPQALIGVLVGYALSVLACTRDRLLYVKLMCLWTLLSVVACVALLRAYALPVPRERIGSVGLLLPCILHVVAVLLNAMGVASVLSGASGSPRKRRTRPALARRDKGS